MQLKGKTRAPPLLWGWLQPVREEKRTESSSVKAASSASLSLLYLKLVSLCHSFSNLRCSHRQKLNKVRWQSGPNPQPIRNVDTRIDLIGQRCKSNMEWLFFELQNPKIFYLNIYIIYSLKMFWITEVDIQQCMWWVMNGISKGVCVCSRTIWLTSSRQSQCDTFVTQSVFILTDPCWWYWATLRHMDLKILHRSTAPPSLMLHSTCMGTYTYIHTHTQTGQFYSLCSSASRCLYSSI